MDTYENNFSVMSSSPNSRHYNAALAMIPPIEWQINDIFDILLCCCYLAMYPRISVAKFLPRERRSLSVFPSLNFDVKQSILG